MIIKSSEINSTDIKGIIEELEDNPDVMNFIRGHNLPSFDVLEAMASKIFYDDSDIDTDDYIR